MPVPTPSRSPSDDGGVRRQRLPAGAEWSYEVKWDGYRAQAVKNGAAVSLASRNLKNITRQFPEVVAQPRRRVHARSAVLDGEIVALDADGRPSFQALHHAATSTGCRSSTTPSICCT